MNKNSKSEFLVLRKFDWSKTTPSCFAFCYPKNGNHFLLTGKEDNVKEFLRVNNQPIVAHYLVFDGKKKIKYIEAYGIKPGYSVSITLPTRLNPSNGKIEKHQRCWIVIDSLGQHELNCVCKPIRYVPRKWLEDLDSYVINDNLIPLVPIPLVQFINKDFIDIPEPVVELTEEEKLERIAIERSANITRDLLKDELISWGVNIKETEETEEIYEVLEN